MCIRDSTKAIPGVGLSLLVFPVGHKENGGIFCHADSWTIVAEARLGRGDRAYEYYRSYLPARYNAIAEVHQAEPYVYSQFTHGPTSVSYTHLRAHETVLDLVCRLLLEKKKKKTNKKK